MSAQWFPFRQLAFHALNLVNCFLIFIVIKAFEILSVTLTQSTCILFEKFNLACVVGQQFMVTSSTDVLKSNFDKAIREKGFVFFFACWAFQALR